MYLTQAYLVIFNYNFIFLLEELVDMKVLKIMKPEHVDRLLNKHPIGIQILFSHHLENWQKSLSHNTVTSITTSPTTSTFLLQKSDNVIKVKLNDILNSSNTGTMIIDYYKANNKLNDNIRSLLVDTVINYIITNKLSMSVSLADCIGNQIVVMFPSEVKVSVWCTIIFN